MIQGTEKILIAGLVVLGVFLSAVPAQAAIQVTDLEIRGQAANETPGVQDYLDLSSGTVSWYPRNFAGFFYELNDESGSEELTILDSASLIGTRTISLDKLVYSIRGDNRLLNVVKYPFNGNYTAAALAGLSGFQAGSMSSEDGKYKAVEWQGEKFITIKNKTNKLSKPVIEQGSSRYDKKLLAPGETWDIGAGWQLTAQSIDAKASPRQVWLVLSKNGTTVDDRVLTQGQIYTYVEKNLAGEVDVPVFVTYIDAIFAGATSDMVQLRYTWVIDTNVIEIKIGDNFGIFTTTKADESEIELRNSRFPVTLARDSTVNLMGNLKFKVANIDVLRFYPISTISEPGIREVRGWAANETAGPRGNLDLSSGIVSWHPQNFAGLYYDLNDGLGNERLTIIDSASLIGTRTILQDKLRYSTSWDNKMMNVVRYPFNGNYTAAHEAGLLEFQAGSMSFEDGKYRIIGWQAERYVAVKNNTSKLSRLVIEQGSGVYGKKTLLVGETWYIGRGWNLTVIAIDAKASPRIVWFALNKDGVPKDDKILTQRQIYTYVERNFAGELNVPLFVTYVDSIFAGATSDMVQFRYTWAIDTNVTEIREGDPFGVFRVTGINSSTIELRNTDAQIALNTGSTVNLMGSLGLRIADSDTLRFFPKADYEIIPLAPTCQYSMIGGHMFEDNDVDGVQDSYEPGMANRIVRMEGTDICSNVTVSMSIQTDAAGYYEFRNIRTGNYLLSEEIAAGWTPTTPGIYRVVIPHSSTNITKDFGNLYYPIKTIGIKQVKVKGGLKNPP